MGYLTLYKLTWNTISKKQCGHKYAPGDIYCPKCGKLINKNNNIDDAVSDYITAHEEIYGIDNIGQSTESVKWYDHEEHMVKMSKHIKDVLFKLEGKGEESGDIWIKYFLNGKKQICRGNIVFDDFDESKLK